MNNLKNNFCFMLKEFNFIYETKINNSTNSENNYNIRNDFVINKQFNINNLKKLFYKI